jgi:hypothetical protein
MPSMVVLVSVSAIPYPQYSPHGVNDHSCLLCPVNPYGHGIDAEIWTNLFFLIFNANYFNTAFSPTATTNDLLQSDCTSCSVAEDKSAYWTPSLYFQDSSTGEFEVVQQEGGMLA